jgi:hypothetical protein
MTGQTVQPQKKRGPPPTGKGEPVQVRLQPDQMAALDAWIVRHPDPKPTRPEAIRRMIVAHLTGERLLPSRPDLRKSRG